MKGQWAPIQSFLDLINDEQAIANDMIFEVEAADGGRPLKLVRGPGPIQRRSGADDPRSAGL